MNSTCQTESTPTATDSASSPPVQTVVQINLPALLAQARSPDSKARAEAIGFLENLCQEQPENAAATLWLGIAKAQSGHSAEAEALFLKALELDPKLASAYCNLGNMYRLNGQRQKAKEAYKKTITIQPDMADAHYNLAIVLEEEGKREEAEKTVRRALMFTPTHAQAHANLGNLLLKSGKVEEAVSHFRQAIVWNPDLLPAHRYLIMALYRLGKEIEAEAEVAKVLAKYPEDTAVLRAQATGLAYRGRFEAAEKINQRLQELDPQAIDLQLNHGELLVAQGDIDEALKIYRELLEGGKLRPSVGLGAVASALLAGGRLSEAREVYRQALMLDATDPSLTLGLAKVLLESGEIALALAHIRRVVEVLPDAAEIRSLAIHWLAYDPTADIKEQRRVRREWQKYFGKTDVYRHKATHRQSGPIKIGLLVNDLDNRTTADALEVLFRTLPQQQAHLTIYHAAAGNSPNTQLLRNLAGDHINWRPCSGLGHADIAAQSHHDGIEVFIDMIGHGPGSRLQVVGHQPAPFVLSWLGDFDSTGVPQLTHKITDAVLDPETGTAKHQEKLLRLPAACPWIPPQDAPEISPARSLSVPVRFGGTGRLAMVNTLVIEIWSEILKQVPDSSLVLFSHVTDQASGIRDRIQRLFALNDIDETRITVLPRLEKTAYWEQMAQVDVMLDTFPWSGGNIMLDCLWLGTPVVTMAGDTPRSRVTSSLLAQAGFSDWITDTVDSYVARAIRAAAERKIWHAERKNIRTRLLQAPAANQQVFCDQLVSLLEQLIVPRTRQPTKRG